MNIQRLCRFAPGLLKPVRFLLCSGLMAVAGLPADAQEIARGIVFVDTNANGIPESDERRLPGVGVSNGRQVVRTDSQGAWSLPVDQDTVIFVIKPAGYRPPLDTNHLSRFYYIHKPAGSPASLQFPGVEPTGPLPASIDFPLHPATEPDAFDVIFFGDPQPRDQKEIDYIAHDVVEGLSGSSAAFGVTLGDILFDDLSLFESINRTIGRIGIPWYNVIGNHDINFSSDNDEHSDETFERFYGPSYYSFDYGKVHFVVIDDIHWIKDGERRFFRSGLSDKQLDFIENDLALVEQSRLVVVMMHIPLVRSTPWIEPQRERLFRILESREHCMSLAGHTHHHEQTMLTAADGWKGSQPHHHIINVTVSGSWWSGQPDDEGIPHTLCADGTPNGYSIMRFDGLRYTLEYRAARREAEFQIRIMAPEVVKASAGTARTFHANVFNAMPDAQVQWSLSNSGSWREMTRDLSPDPLFQILFDQQEHIPTKSLPWRKLPKPMICPHLWKAELNADLPPGTYTIFVRATNPGGQVLQGNRVVRVE